VVSATLNVALSAASTDGLNAMTYVQLEFAASVPPGVGQVLGAISQFEMCFSNLARLCAWNFSSLV
jgi:hypothetical protein